MLGDKVKIHLLNGEVITRNLHTWDGKTFYVSYNNPKNVNRYGYTIRQYKVAEFCGDWYEVADVEPFEHRLQADNRAEYEELIQYALDLGYEIIGSRDNHSYGTVYTRLGKYTLPFYEQGDDMYIEIDEELFEERKQRGRKRGQ